MSLASTGNVTIACAAAGWPRKYPYSLRKADKDFAEKWDFAVETAADLLEAAALQRAVHGVQKDVWHKPKEGSPIVIGQETIYSDRLLETLLKANNPAKFNPGQSKDDAGGNKGGVLLIPAAVPLDQWEASAATQQAGYREKRED